MKIVTTTAAALFLFAATGLAIAQSNNNEGGNDTAGETGGDNNNQGGDNNANQSGDNNTNQSGAVGSEDGAGSNAGEDAANSAAGNSGVRNDCSDFKAGSDFSQMSAKCREGMDKWAMGQSGSVAYEGDLAVGTVLPETVVFTDVPDMDGYGYVMLNDRRVMVDRGNRTVVHVYE